MPTELMSHPENAIAIVGFGGLFPGAKTLDGFWSNIAGAVDSTTEVPPGRWLIDPATASDPRVALVDHVHSIRGGFVETPAVDTSELAIDAALLDRLDPVFRLAIHAASEAWRNALTRKVNRARVGVVFGNIVLPTEAASAFSRAVLAPIFEESIGLPPGKALEIDPLNAFPAGLPASMVARSLGFGGNAYTLDAACASSLYALKLACDELRSGRVDAMVTGGVSRPDSLYTQMGFSQLRALSARGKPAPFDQRGDGLVVGEGAGMFVLKRLADALEQGDTIHGIVAGIGLANDIHGDLLAPSSEGQLRAMRTAYQEAGWSPVDVDLIECHATGTPLGDAVELESLKALWREAGVDRRAERSVIGSVKSNIGHALTAAGAAGLLKVLLALAHRRLPPTANFAEATAAIGLDDSPFRVLTQAEDWPEPPSGRPRRAALSGFGFGGINAHVLIEEWTPARVTATASPPARPRSASRSSVAIVGVAAHLGPFAESGSVKAMALGGDQPQSPSEPANWWGFPGATFPGHYLESLDIPIGRFRIPPRELAEMLPQQSLMLKVAADSLANAGWKPGLAVKTGVLIGIGLDLNATNFHLRWSLADRARQWNARYGWNLSESDLSRLVEELRHAAGPPLDANRTMGSLGGLIASRIAREFRIGGPSFTISSDETSGVQAVAVAADWLSRGELDAVVVGAVDLAGDLRSVLAREALGFLPRTGPVACDGAVALVLRRLDDAIADNDKILAIVSGIGSVSAPADSVESTRARARRIAYEQAGLGESPIQLLEDQSPRQSGQVEEARAQTGSLEREIGHLGAASGLAAIARTALALGHEILPPRGAGGGGRYWLRNRDDGPRRAAVVSTSQGGNHQHLILEQPPMGRAGTDRRALDLSTGLFAIEADDSVELGRGLDELTHLAREAGDATAASIARRWWRRRPNDASRRLGLAFVANDRLSLEAQLATARVLVAGGESGRNRPGGVYYRAAATGKVAFVYPGLGSYFAGMGRELSAYWPEVLREQDGRTRNLRAQLDPSVWWNGELPASFDDHRIPILGQVAVGSFVTELLRRFGVEPAAAIGYSLGESAALVSLLAWPNRDEMYDRLWSSPLFHTELCGPCHAARRFWNLAVGDSVDWVAGIASAAPDAVRAAVGGRDRVYILIINTPREVVIGGRRDDVDRVIARLGCPFIRLSTVSTVHCPIGATVENEYRALHTLETNAPTGILFFGGVSARPYAVDRDSAARSITAQAANTIDFPAIVERAYADQIRVFLEVGPGNSCTRLIPEILGDRPHLAVSACRTDRDAAMVFLDVLAQLIAHRVPVDLGLLYGQTPGPAASESVLSLSAKTVRIPVRQRAFPPVSLPAIVKPQPDAGATEFPIDPRPMNTQSLEYRYPRPSGGLSSLTAALVDTERATAAAHGAFLRVSQQSLDLIGRQISDQLALLEKGRDAWPESHDVVNHAPADGIHDEPASSSPTALSRNKCLEFAVGSIAHVLGAEFAEVDRFPTRVRLPDEPLMLVDRVLEIEGTPRSMTSGRIVTEHVVHEGAWYLDGGRIAPCIAIEAGQADLMLSAYLGVDFQTEGLAVYRLLDATVTYHRGLPGPGKVILFDIRITSFFRQGKTILFRFQFDATVDGEPLLMMRDGCAGFFTADELAAGRGIVPRSLVERAPKHAPEVAVDHLVPMRSATLDSAQLEALRRGDLGTAFSAPFDRLPPGEQFLTLPGGRMRLVDRVTALEPAGGTFKAGLIRAEADIHPDDWFMVCHFVDDRVMPGTLMYECCLHTLRIFLIRMGWIGRAGQVAFEPVPGIQNRLKCRGQITEATKVVAYEVTIKRIGYRPEPYAVADALIYGDGKPIVEFSDMAIQLTGTNRSELDALWSSGRRPVGDEVAPAYDQERVLAYAIGKPSIGFGERYRIFDEERFLSRLPGPPYLFVDQITRVDGVPFELKVGTSTEARYDIPPDAWYFEADRQDQMPFAVLLEVALQPCGWLAAYMGSALTSDLDLRFRNLGGSAIQHRPVTRQTGTLTTRITVTKITVSAGMILQHFSLDTSSAEGPVYTGSTEFGFFPDRMLRDQVGIRNAEPYELSANELGRAERFAIPADAPFPDSRWRMIDEVDALVLDGGPAGLGLIRGSARVNPGAWFFAAHFLGDPVWPGSLGLESMIQLMKVLAARKWGASAQAVFECPGIDQPHEWTYRGQIIPANQRVTVQAVITACDDRRRRIVADGHLDVDGKTIYQMKGFSLRLADADGSARRVALSYRTASRPLVGL
jgi:acyl transferase domain-containing protein/3-hydroxymyristoyl/3-hydroxydecanoyl-(acyl carrier protein) dehydratase